MTGQATKKQKQGRAHKHARGAGRLRTGQARLTASIATGIHTMNDFRAVVAIFIACISGYLCIDMLLNGFSWVLLLAAMAGFALVHVIWPPKQNYESAWYDTAEVIFDFPYRLTASMLRTLAKWLSDW